MKDERSRPTYCSIKQTGIPAMSSPREPMRINFSIRSLLFALLILAVPVVSSAQLVLSIGIAPPPLPVYEQPLCPGDSYIWTPGYWAYAEDGYFWVPGTWVLAPEAGLL